MPDPDPSSPTLVQRITRFADRPAVVDALGTATYRELDRGSVALAAQLLEAAGPVDERRSGGAALDDARVVILCRPGAGFVTALLAVWHAGGLAVPFHHGHPLPELLVQASDADPALVVTTPAEADAGADLAAATGAGHVVVDLTGRPVDAPPDDAGGSLPDPADPARPALMVFTSGTTGRPKGVVHTHASLQAQIESMVSTWGWSADDRILSVLPLHHVHGLVNVTLVPLWVGAVLEAADGFDVVATWERLASGEVTVFMAVPTIYARLVRTWREADVTTQARWSEGAAHLRLMVSGSAALPVTVLDEWRAITGQVLLERYGMTEVGMALGNTLDHRVPGHVGVPFPGVQTRIVDDGFHDVPDGEAGELLLRGPQLFAGYWNRPEATAEAFADGWFRTGDVAVHDPDGFRLLGRASVDILKSGGEKVSALEIEAAYRDHPAVGDCAVVGLPDDEWGQRVAMAVVPAEGFTPDPTELRAWGKARLAPAKVPTRYVVVDDLPRNAMGKVTKPDVVHLFDEPTAR